MMDDNKSAWLRSRTKKFALRIIRLFQALPNKTDAQVLGKQLLRCGTSVAANYHSACRARSKPDFISRMAIVAEEADESILWLELLSEAGIMPAKRLASLIREAGELTAIFTASHHTAKQNNSAVTQFRSSVVGKKPKGTSNV